MREKMWTWDTDPKALLGKRVMCLTKPLFNMSGLRVFTKMFSGQLHQCMVFGCFGCRKRGRKIRESHEMF